MRRAILVALVLSTFVVSGCGIVPGMNTGKPPGVAVASEKERVSAEVPGEDLSQLVAGNSAFAFDLYQLLADERAGENLFYSPYSISLALAMTYAGAEGQTERQMAETLHFALPEDDLHPAFNALDQEVASRGEDRTGGGNDEESDDFELNIANAIWGQEDYQFLDAFLDTLAQNYGAGLRVLDFASDPEEARVTINEWVSEETEGKIKDLIPRRAIGPLTRLVLTNAIYFNASWMHPFEESATEDGAFTRLDGSQVNVPLMRQTESFGYADGEGYQALELPYAGGEMSMVVLLPETDRFTSFEQSLDAQRLHAIVEDLTYQQVAVTLPKFEFDSSLGLNDALTELGMPAAFSADADFSGMTGSKDLFISDVLHKAFVSVDEEGTEAAAATAVVMVESAMPGEPVGFVADHPFLFLIRDRNTGSILFVGRVLDPSA